MGSVIPALRDSSTSSAKAVAVMATMGMVLASRRFRLRMRLVASYPSITGIITSIRMMSKVPAGALEKAYTACWPLKALVTEAPASVKKVSAISMFRSLSSTSRT